MFLIITPNHHVGLHSVTFHWCTGGLTPGLEVCSPLTFASLTSFVFSGYDHLQVYAIILLWDLGLKSHLKTEEAQYQFF